MELQSSSFLLGEKIMNEDTTQTSVANTTDTQQMPKDETEDKTIPVTDVPTQSTSVVETKPEPKDDSAALILPDPTPAPEAKKLSDVTETSLVWISGLVGDRQIDCAGPIELPFKITKPTWPYTPVEPNSNYTNQIFDYENGTWVATDAKSQGQQITDLTKQIAKLNQDSVKHDQAAEQSQKMVMQQMQMLTAINTKLDKLTKDGDK